MLGKFIFSFNSGLPNFYFCQKSAKTSEFSLFFCNTEDFKKVNMQIDFIGLKPLFANWFRGKKSARHLNLFKNYSLFFITRSYLDLRYFGNSLDAC
jgi:hypothetical protein